MRRSKQEAAEGQIQSKNKFDYHVIGQPTEREYNESRTAELAKKSRTTPNFMGLLFQPLTGETHKKSLQPQATHTQQAAFDRQGQAAFGHRTHPSEQKRR